MLPFTLVVIYIVPLYNNVFLIVKEKESRTRESMRMMGMTDFPYWLSWFVHFTIINTILSTVAWAILCINVITYSDKFLILAFFWLYGESIFGIILFLQTLFGRAKYSGYASTLIYFAGYLAFIAVQEDTAPEMTNTVLSIIPQVVCFKMSTIFGEYETRKIGLNQDTMDEKFANYTFKFGLCALAFDFAFFSLLGLYLEKVLPKEYGERYPVWFLCTSDFWGCCKKKNPKNN